MKPRKRRFKQDNKLKLAYIKDHSEFGNDFMGIVPKGEEGRWDLNLLFYQFLKRPIQQSEWDRENKCYIEYPSLIDELEKRGYDKTTLYFEIEKKKEEKDNDR